MVDSVSAARLEAAARNKEQKGIVVPAAAESIDQLICDTH